jgi:hypothetical protein
VVVVVGSNEARRNPPERAAEAPAEQARALDDAWLGKLLDGRYRLEQRIGTNATHTVYRARDREQRRSAAVMILHEQLTRRPGVVESFLDEVRAVSRIRHAHLLKVEDLGRASETAYLVAEWMSGPTLEQWASPQAPLTWVRVRPLAIQVTKALLAAHHRKVLHGSLRLRSCFVSEGEAAVPMIKLGGFGFTAVRPPDELGPAATERADLQAVGVMLVRLLTRDGLRVESRAEAQMRPLLGLSEPVIGVIRRALSDDESTGFESAQDLLAALEDPFGHARGEIGGRGPASKPRGEPKPGGAVLSGPMAEPRPAPLGPTPAVSRWPSPLFDPAGPGSMPVPASPFAPPLVPIPAVASELPQPSAPPVPSAPPLVVPPPTPNTQLSGVSAWVASLAPPTATIILSAEDPAATTIFDRQSLHGVPKPPPARGPEGTIQLDPDVLAVARGEDVPRKPTVAPATVAVARTVDSRLDPTHCLDRDELGPVAVRDARPQAFPMAVAPLPAAAPMQAFPIAAAAVPVAVSMHASPMAAVVAPRHAPPVAAVAPGPSHAPPRRSAAKHPPEPRRTLRSDAPHSITGLIVVGLVVAVCVGAVAGLFIAQSAGSRSGKAIDAHRGAPSNEH